MEVAVVGSGYVGLVAGACFADCGNSVICVDKDESKVAALNRGQIPIYEPGLADLVKHNADEGRLKFTTDLSSAVKVSEIIFIAVGTPQDEDGSADLTHVLAVAAGIGKAMNGFKIVVNKSTVPVGTAALVADEIKKHTQHKFDVVSNPEFLKEGAALDDFMRPDRVVIGVSSNEAASIMRELYAPFLRTDNPLIIMDVTSAEMTKYAANTMLASRISLMNEFAGLCEKVGADIDLVRRGIGTDRRIGNGFLFPGIGYGGSCFPKDVQALIKTGERAGCDMKISKALEAVNKEQKGTLVRQAKAHFKSLAGMTFAVWGLAFKPRTDDTREAPAIVTCQELIAAGARLQVFDPEANDSFKDRFGGNEAITYFNNSYEALASADALFICTEWSEFRRPNFQKIKTALKTSIVFDGRNLYDAETMQRYGFTYYSIGRPVVKG